ncbi:MAG: transcription termination/antitermination protein NusG [bacterium]
MSEQEASSPSKDPVAQEPAAEDSVKKRWYVLQAFSGYEKKVKQSLQEHIDRAGMQDLFGDILVPTEEVVEMKAGQKRTSERKFFPGYVLVNMAMTDETWHLVKGVPRVAGFIGGTENRPMPISDREADEIIQQVSDSADAPKMKFTFAPGELVRIIDGPFADFNGTVEDANFEKSKLRVSVTIFGRSTPVELDFTQVEKG